MYGTLEIVRTTLAVEYPLLSVQKTAETLLVHIYGPEPINIWTECPALRKLIFVHTADLIECLTILAEGDRK